MIYFLGLDWFSDTPRVKIGYSSDFSKRLASHCAEKHGVRVDIDVLCVVKGSRSDEKALHRHFDKWHFGGSEDEVFHASDELVGYIRWLRNQWFTWVPDDDCGTGADIPSADFSQWKPGDGRTTAAIRQSGLFPDEFKRYFPPREVTGDDFYTHERIIECARETMGHFDLDPASHPVANQKVRASRIHTFHDSGLEHEWTGNVWLNPPFSQWSEWAAKIESEWKSGRIDQMCVLAATRTITAQHFKAVKDNCSAICILHGRIPFWGPKATSSPDDGHVVFYFGQDIESFEHNFSRIGVVFGKLGMMAVA